MVDFTEYGDTTGTLSDRDRGGDQTLTGPTPEPFILVRLVGDAEVLADRAQGGDDTIRTQGNRNVLIGDAQSMVDRARGGDDTLGGSGLSNTTLYGDAVEISGRAQGGDDVLDAPVSPFARTSTSSDLFGDAYTLSDRAEGGDDTLVGSSGYLGSTARLYGDGYELLDRAEGGDDRLVSGSAPDEMWGDAYLVSPDVVTGSDVFVFAPANDRDLIHDFERGKDRIDLTAFAEAGIGNFEALAPRIVEQADGSLVILDDARFRGSAGNSVVVAGAFGLGADDFLFG